MLLLTVGCADGGRAPIPAAVGAAVQGATAAPTPASSARGPRSGAIRATGKVVPAQHVDLSFPNTGRVQSVAVHAGDRVAAGATLASQDRVAAESAVSETQAGLARAQAQLADLRAGPRAEELAAAQDAVDVAQAQLARLQEGPQAEDVAAAQAALAAARANLKKVQSGPDANTVQAAAADLANAEAEARQAQAAYDQIKGNADAGLHPEALRLEQATNALEAAKARYAEARQGPSAADVAAAQAGVDQAAAALAKAQAAARPADMAEAEATLRRAQDQAKLLGAGSRPAAISAAEADVAAALANYERAQAAMADLDLVAPFAGTVSALQISPGQVAGPTQPALTLAGLDHLQVETTDLSERDVARVAAGAPVTLYIEALGQETAGRVAQVAPQANVVSGDVVYTVTVDLDRQVPGLRWGMTAQVDIPAP